MEQRPRTYQFRIDAEGVQQLARELEQFGEAGRAAFDKLTQASPQLANTFRRAGDEAERAGRALRGVGENASPLATIFRDVDGTLSGFAGRLGGVGTALARLGPVGLAAGAALGALSIGARAAVREFQETEQRVLRLDAVLRATGTAAGVTSGEIVELASAIQRATTATDNQVLEAAAALATFRSVAGETFRTTLRLGADMAEVFGGDVRSSVTQLGKALEDPIQGLTALRRIGVTFSESQREVIENFVRTGDVAQAQRAILAGVEEQLGGAAAGAAGGVAGAAKRVSDAWSDLLKRFADTTGLAGAARSALEALAGTLNAMESAITPADPRERLNTVQQQLRSGVGAFGAMEEAIARATGQPAPRGRSRLDAQQMAALQREELRLLAEIEVAEREIALARVAGQEEQARQLEERRAQHRAALAEVLTGLQREADQARLASAERERTVAIERAIAEARKANPDVTEAELAQVRALVIARFDAAEAVKRQEEATRRAATETQRLEEQSRRAAEAVVERLLRDSEDQWERYTREVDEARAAMEKLGTAAEDVARIERVLRERNPAARAFADLTRREAEEQQRAAERAAEEYTRVWQRATDTAVKASGDLFFDLFTGRARSIGETFRSMLLRAVSDAAANFLIRPIIAPVIGAVGGAVGSALGIPGAGGGGGIGGIGNLLSFGSSAYQAATGQSIFGGLANASFGGLFSTAAPAITSAQAAGVVSGALPPFTFGAGAGGTSGLLGISAGSALGAAGLGFGAGALLGAFGANRTVSSIGGAGLGALGGFLAGGPVGAIIGGVGGLLGGLLGGSRKPGFSGGTSLIGVDPATGLLTVIGATGKRFDPGEVERAAAQQIAPLNALMQRAGITVSSAGMMMDPLTGRSPYVGYGIGLGDGAQYGQDLDTLIRVIAQAGRFQSDDAITRRVLASGGITGSESMERGLAFAELFRTLTEGTDTATQMERAMRALREQLDEARKSAVEFGFSVAEIDAATRDAFMRDIRRGIKAIEDPLALALEDFDRAAELRLAVARELGADLVEVERLTALERARINEQFQSQITSGLRRLVDDIAFGGLSSAAPEQRFFSALTRFNQAERAALANPTSAAAVSEFEAAARAVLPIARDFLGTSQRFGELENRVLGTAVRLDPAADPAAIAADRIVQAQATMTAALVAPIGAVRDEVVALRERMDRLALDIAALARRAAA